MMVKYYIMIQTDIIKFNGPPQLLAISFDPIRGILSMRLIGNAIQLKGFAISPLRRVPFKSRLTNSLAQPRKTKQLLVVSL